MIGESCMKTIASFVEGRDNNFNLIRFVSAWLVLFAHSYVLSRNKLYFNPIRDFTGIQPGNIAVDIFFITSGFLVSMSFIKRGNPIFFATARILRIYPALIVAVLFNVLVVGPLFTEIPMIDYFRNSVVYEYIIVNSLLIGNIVQLRYYLPSVFEANPYSPTVNGSLWTLPYEMWLYILLFIAGTTGFLKRRSLFNWLYGLFIAQYAIGILFFSDSAFMQRLDSYERFASLFLTGAFFYVNRDSIPLNAYLFTLCLAVMYFFHEAAFYPPVYLFILAYLIFWLAFIPAGFIRKFNHLGDYSYGMYIYAYPIQQGILAVSPNAEPWMITLIATGTTLMLAILSWHLIEDPFLKRKDLVYLRVAAVLKKIPLARKFSRII